MKKLSWILGGLIYSLLMALVPGAIWIFGGLLYDILKKLGDGASWVIGLPWSIKIPVYIIIGLCIQFFRPLFESKNSRIAP
jgi:hypothetical protein